MAGASDRHRSLISQSAQDLHVQEQMIPVVRAELLLEILGHHDFIVALLLGGRNVDIVSTHGIDIFLPVPGDDQLEVGLFRRRLQGTIFPALGIHVHGEGFIIPSGILPHDRGIVALTIFRHKAQPAVRIIVIGKIPWRLIVTASESDRIHAILHIEHHAVEHGPPDFMFSQFDAFLHPHRY